MKKSAKVFSRGLMAMPGWETIQSLWNDFLDWAPLVLPVLSMAITVVTIAWVLMTKKDATSATAWCLLVFFVPVLGAIMFVFFGDQHVTRPLQRKRKHKQLYHQRVRGEPVPKPGPASGTQDPSADLARADSRLERMAWLAQRFGAFPATAGNRVDFYHDGPPAFDAMFEAIRAARHHVHLQTFIFQPDATGQLFLDLLTQKAKEGVQVRLLYDAMGSIRFHRQLLAPLWAAGGKSSVFFPLNPFRRRLQVNMRNHRKIMVIDGQIGFVGGLNVGDEYLGKVTRFGFWRDTHLRIEGPAVSDLQRVFCEDWDFAAEEHLEDRSYFAPRTEDGPYPVQVIDSGPDRELKGIREMYFAAILQARRRVWIASPYFVPDAGLRDALRLAGYRGVDVRLLGQYHPDKWIPLYAARYYWTEMLEAGVKVYQYTRGMMHAKVVLVDEDWATVGTANLDNRSLYLNFEVNCLLYSPQAVAELEAAFCRDLGHSIRLDRDVYSRRPFAGRLLENACRLLSPVL
jgi:cardiolipin synthase